MEVDFEKVAGTFGMSYSKKLGKKSRLFVYA